MEKRGCWLIVCIFLCNFLGGREVCVTLARLPAKEVEKIETLFAFFVQKDSLGYVLFGETKPVCFTGIPLNYREYVLPYSLEKPKEFQKNIRLGWEAWIRHRHLFKPSNIVICEEYQRVDGGWFLQLFFVNKKTLFPLLVKYRDDFSEVLGADFSPERFIETLEKKKVLRPLIYNDQKLLGLLLGFGRESSATFRDMMQGKEVSDEFKKVGYRPQGCTIVPVCFRANPDSPEVKELVETFTKEIQEIEKIYKSDRFLTHTLEALCG